MLDVGTLHHQRSFWSKDHLGFLFSHWIGKKEEREEKERGRIDRDKREEVKLLMEIIHLMDTPRHL